MYIPPTEEEEKSEPEVVIQKLSNKEMESIASKRREAYTRRKKQKKNNLSSINYDRTIQSKLARQTKETALDTQDYGVAERIFNIQTRDRTLHELTEFDKSLSQKKRDANKLYKKGFDRSGKKIKSSYRAEPKRVSKDLDYKEKAKRIREARKGDNLNRRAMKSEVKAKKKIAKKQRQADKKNLPFAESDISSTSQWEQSLLDTDHLVFTNWEEDIISMGFTDSSDKSDDHISFPISSLSRFHDSSGTDIDIDCDYPSTEAGYGITSNALSDGYRYLGLGASALASKVTMSLLKDCDDTTLRIFKVVNIFLALCTSTSALTDYTIFNLIQMDPDFSDLDYQDAWDSISKYPFKKRFVGHPDFDDPIFSTDDDVFEKKREYDLSGDSFYDGEEKDYIDSNYPSTEAKKETFFMEGEKIASTPWADTLRSTFREFKYLMEGEFFETVRSFCFSLVSLVTLPKSSVIAIKRMFGKCKTMTIFEGVDQLVASIGKFLEYVELSIKGFSLSTILCKKGAVYALGKHYKELKVDYTNLSYGLPIGQSVPARDFITDLKEWLSDVQTAHKKARPFSDDLTQLHEMRAWGTITYKAVKSQLQGKRFMPYGVIIHGPPGIGKSTILDIVYYIFSDIFGREFDPGMVYQRNTGSAFWDQHEPWAQPYIHESEVGNLKTDIAKRSGDPALTEVCSIMDCEPYPVDIAVAEKKGTVFVNPELLIIDTNNPNLNAIECVNNAAAIMRRFIFIKPTVKKEFAQSRGMIDTSITDEATFFDKWTFTISLRTPVNCSKWTEHVLLKDGSTTDLENFLQEDIIRHFTQQAAKPLKYQVRNKTHHGVLKKISKHEFPAAKEENFFKELPPELAEDFEQIEHIPLHKWSDPSGDKEITPEVLKGLKIREFSSRDFPTYASAMSKEEDSDDEDVIDVDFFSDEIGPDYSSDSSYDDDLEEKYDTLPLRDFDHSCVKPKTEAGLVVRKFRDVPGYLRRLERRAIKGAEWIYLHTSHGAEWVYSRAAHGSYYSWLATCAATTCFGVLLKVIFMITLALFLSGKKNEAIQGMYRTLCHFFMVTIFLISLTFCSWRFALYSIPFFLLSLCDILPFLRYINRRTLKSVVNVQLSHLQASWMDFRQWTYMNFPELLLGTAQIAGSILVIRAVFGLFQSSENELTSEGNITSFPTTTPETEKTKVWEERYEVTVPYKRVRNKLNEQLWTTVNVSPMDTSHHGSPQSLYASVSNNSRKFEVIMDDGNVSKSYALGIHSNYYLVPRHAFGKGKFLNTEVRIATCNDPHPKAYVTLTLQESNYKFFSTDHIMLFVTSINCKDILSHVPSKILELKRSEAIIDGSLVSASFVGPFECSDKLLGIIRYPNGVIYAWPDHSVGKCGLPLIWTTSKGVSSIAGVHVAGDLEGSLAYASMFTREELIKCISSFSTGLMKTHSLGPEDKFKLPYAQSLIHYEPSYSPTYLGNVGTNKTFHQKSKLRETVISRKIRSQLNLVYGDQDFDMYAPPLMQTKRVNGTFLNPYNVMYRKVANVKKTLDLSILQITISQVTKRICHNLEEVGINPMQPYNIDVAFNGSSFDEYCRSIDLSKSAGYGTPGKKRNYIYTHEDKIYPEDRILQEVNGIIEAYESGHTVRINFEANMKDEPRLKEKVDAGKTRIFYATPFAFYIVMRAFLLPLMNNMSAHSECFYTSIGIDMHRQAGLVYDRIKTMSDNVIEGDYSGYDTSMPVDIGLAAATVTENILAHFGYTEDQLNIVRGILTESIYVCVVINGDKFMIPGLQPSGKLGTAEDNSLRGLIMLVYAWNSSDCCHLDFFEHVSVCTYGDDVVASVSEEARSFNAVFYAEFCQEVFGLTFTTAGKGKVEKEFISPDEMSFLKRTFVYSAELDRIVAPLAMDSIARSCSWYIPSNSVTTFTQMEDTVLSVLRELFFHSTEEQYNLMRTYLNEELLEGKSDLPVYDLIKESLSLDSIHVQEEEHVSNDSYDYPASEAGNTDHLVDSRISCDGFRRPLHLNQWRENTLLNDFISDLKEVEYDLNEMEDPYPGYSFRILRKMPSVRNSLSWPYVQKYHSLISYRDSLSATIQRLEQGELRKSTVFTEADIGETDMENLYDVVGETPIIEKEDDSQYFETGQRNYLSLEDYLSRPLEIASMSVAPGAHLTFSTEIWDAFLDHPSIRAKLRNYAYLRADMNIRVTISGSPFHYSKVMVSYQPYAAYNENLKYYGGQLLGTNRQQALCYLSQSPNVGYLDVRDNQPLDMVLPFICAQPMLRLYNNSPLIISDATPLDDAANLGQIFVNTINTVESASATPTSISVFIYAWMTNVEFGCPTGTVMTIGTESNMGDERIVGPIERISSKVASVMGMASKIPVFAPFTSVASTIASTISGMAAIFGFSKPTMNTSPLRTNPQAFQNGAYTIGYDTTKKICLDPMQELTVDAHCVATDTDDMLISELCSRESLIDIFSWTDSDTPLGTAIWLSPVNPIIADRHLTVGTTYTVCPTPMAWAARPFLYWRGDITYRLEVVCSQYHRGKLAIYYEPNVPQNTVIDTTLDINKQYIKIIDIQEVQDLTFTVEWAFPRAWARISSADMDFNLGDIGFGGTNWFDSANGYIAIVPFTSLQSPDGSDISVNVYTYSDNMVFNRIDNFYLMSRPATEADMGDEKEDLSIVLNPSSASMEHIGQMHFGEIPLSFRALLKRYMARGNPLISGTGNVLDKVLVYDSTLFPVVVPAYTGTPSVVNLFSYLRYGYLGMKGGMKYRTGVIGKMTVPDCSYANVTLVSEGSHGIDTLSTQTANEFLSAYASGTVSYHIGTNGGVEYELPLYTNNMFLLSFSNNPVPTGETTFDSNYSDSYRVSWPIQTIDTLSNMSVEVNSAIGDDFSFMRFQGCPAYSYTL